MTGRVFQFRTVALALMIGVAAGLVEIVFRGQAHRLILAPVSRLLQTRSVVASGNVTVTVDVSVLYQRLEGFGQAAPNALVYVGAQTLSDSLRATAIDAAFRRVGINMGTAGGLLESPGSYDQRQNDNSDPFSINWAGFNADALTATKRYLIDLAKPFGFTNYFLGAEAPNVRWGSPWLAAIRSQDYSRFLDEAAEQVLANVTYWKNTYGEELPYYQLGNEQFTGNHASINPDMSGYGGVDPTQQMIDLAKRAGARLRAAGFSRTRFIVGNEETEETSYQLALAILGDTEARQYVGAIGYHSYPYNSGYSSISFILSTSGAGAPDASRIAIRNKIRDLAQQYNVPAWMTENSNAGDPLSYDDFRARAIHIHDEFLYTNAAAYFCFTSMWDLLSQQGHAGDSNLYGSSSEGTAVLINNSTGRVNITGIGYAIGHYARWIKPGAIRVDAQSSDPLVQVTAFRDNGLGRLALVLINNSSAPVTVTARLAGGALSDTLSGEQSTPAGYWTMLPAFMPDSAGTFQVLLPPASVTSIAGKLVTGPGTQQSRVVSTASYAAPLAPDSIATLFVPGLAIDAATAAPPYPATLSGINVTVQDSAGNIGQAPLFFVSPNQINFHIPAGMVSGPAFFTVTGAAGLLASAPAMLVPTSPGLFSANADGAGVAAAQILRIHPDGTQTLDAVFQCGATPGSCQPVPLNLQPGQDRVFLIFYGTGVRYRPSLSDVVLTIGNQNVEVIYAGPQPDIPGLDQINAMAPSVRGPADLRVILAVSGVRSNTLAISAQ